jgi:transcriptional regulator with XRE-family HTH domain
VTSDRRAFGERLRRQRERHHVTLEAIAQTTKVAASLFAGLERGDCSRWPGGVYNRAFIRAYAAAVQLDPDDTAAEFAEYYEAVQPPIVRPPADNKLLPVASAPLRLIIEVDPLERRWRTLARGAVMFIELVLIALLAGIAAVASGASFWLTLAIASVGYQILGRLLGAGSPLDRLMLPAPKPERARDQKPAEDGTVGETVETVA